MAESRTGNAVCRSKVYVGRFAVLEQNERTLHAAHFAHLPVIQEHLAAVKEVVFLDGPMDAVGGQGVNTAVLFAADVAVHVLGHHVIAVSIAPDEGILKLQMVAEDRLIDHGLIAAPIIVGLGYTKLHFAVQGLVIGGLDIAAGFIHHDRTAILVKARSGIGGKEIIKMRGAGIDHRLVVSGPGTEYAFGELAAENLKYSI